MEGVYKHVGFRFQNRVEWKINKAVIFGGVQERRIKDGLQVYEKLKAPPEKSLQIFFRKIFKTLFSR